MGTLLQVSPAPVRHIWRHGSDDFDWLLGEVRIAVLSGRTVRLHRMSGGHYDIVLNGCLLLVRNSDGNAVATVDNVAAGIMAGDRWLESDEWSYEDPRGLA